VILSANAAKYMRENGPAGMSCSVTQFLMASSLTTKRVVRFSTKINMRDLRMKIKIDNIDLERLFKRLGFSKQSELRINDF
jgi:hypothetical protein